ncbi:SWIM zinc finger protein [Oleiphilus messinensis]|uniref:SWIM zinc finger protein n=1 Tax=Oleiphilus messinensis TaxID=141451 RepID=A0A1Y0I2I3_9GAMM|nr:hypothetical protein [Oleiphilus messinensis]ARU54708.1 SWIM zinc finger protein [Oleiphilus messinensis]
MALDINAELLTKLAGQQTYENGKHLFENDAVSEVDVHRQASRDTVQGSIRDATNSYSAILKLSPTTLEGSCNCPESEGFDFCKHCAALALEFRRLQSKLGYMDQGSDREKILSYLLRKDKTSLAKSLLTFIESDPLTTQRYLLHAHLTSGNIDYHALRKQITETTRVPKNLFRQKHIQNFFENIELLWELIEEHKTNLAPDKLQKLCEYSLSRLQNLLSELDSAIGFHEPVLKTIVNCHQYSLNRTQPNLEKRYKYLESIWSDENQSIYPKKSEILQYIKDEAFRELLNNTILSPHE